MESNRSLRVGNKQNRQGMPDAMERRASSVCKNQAYPCRQSGQRFRSKRFIEMGESRLRDGIDRKTEAASKGKGGRARGEQWREEKTGHKRQMREPTLRAKVNKAQRPKRLISGSATDRPSDFARHKGRASSPVTHKRSKKAPLLSGSGSSFHANSGAARLVTRPASL